MSDFEQLTKKLRKQRSGYRSRITIALRLLKEEEDLTQFILKDTRTEVDKWQTLIEQLNDEIEELCESNSIFPDDEKRQADNENEIVNKYKIIKEFASSESKLAQLVNVNQQPPAAQASKVIDAEELAKAIAEMQKGSPAPK